MVLVGAVGSESRFAAYVEGLATVIGHKDRVGPLRDYCTGLMLPCERKSVEPMAAVTAPARTAAEPSWPPKNRSRAVRLSLCGHPLVRGVEDYIRCSAGASFLSGKGETAGDGLEEK